MSCLAVPEQQHSLWPWPSTITLLHLGSRLRNLAGVKKPHAHLLCDGYTLCHLIQRPREHGGGGLVTCQEESLDVIAELDLQSGVPLSTCCLCADASREASWESQKQML